MSASFSMLSQEMIQEFLGRLRGRVFKSSDAGYEDARRVQNGLIDRRPGLRVVIRSSVAPWLVERTAAGGVSLSRAEVDTGVVQLDSLNLAVATALTLYQIRGGALKI